MVVAYVEIVGTGASGLAPSVLLTVGHKRFLFNCPEQLQRFATSNRLHVNKLRGIFFTEIDWDRVGGFSDVLMTVADNGRTDLDVIGPSPDLLKFVLSMQTSLYRPSMSLKLHSVNGSGGEGRNRGPVRYVIAEDDDEEEEDEKAKIALKKGDVLKKGKAKGKAAAAPKTEAELDYEEVTVFAIPLFEAEPSDGEERSNMDLIDFTLSWTTYRGVASPIRDEVASSASTSGAGDPGSGSASPASSSSPAALPAGVEIKRVQCYAVHTPKTRGRFDAQIARSLGVPPGPLCGKLTKGETIMTPQGQEVKPSDCIGPSLPGPIVLIISCPSEEDLSMLLSNKEIAKYHDSDPNVSCVIHMTPKCVVDSPRYVEWVKTFAAGQKVTHLFLDQPYSRYLDRTLYPRSDAHGVLLNHIEPVTFPVPFDLDAKLKRKASKNPSTDAPSSSGSTNAPKGKKPVQKKGGQAKPAPDTAEMNEEPAKQLAQLFGKDVKFALADNLLKYHLHPLKLLGVDRERTAELDTANFDPLRQVFQNREELREAMEEMKASLAGIPPAEGETEDLGEIVFLGTIASASTKVRCESSIYVRIPGYGGILLDAGGGTYQQMIRKFGTQRTEELLRDLKCVWVTHKHGDHCAGLIQIVRAVTAARKKFSDTSQSRKPTPPPHRRKFSCDACHMRFTFEPSLLMHRTIHMSQAELRAMAEKKRAHYAPAAWPPLAEDAPIFPSHVFTLEDIEGSLTTELEVPSWFSNLSGPQSPLLVVAPMWMETWLTDFSQVEPLEFNFVDGFHLHQPDHFLRQFFLKELGLKSIQAVIVTHSYPTYAIVMEHLDGWRLVYSGDTRPCEHLIELGKGATILIHEATFEEDMQSKAVADSHSTVNEALYVAAQMKVDWTVLTHFSARLEKRLPDLWNSAEPQLVGSVLLAQDFMTLPLKCNTDKGREILKRCAAAMRPMYLLFLHEEDLPE